MTITRSGPGGAVLVVDDDPDTTDLLRDTLRRRGFDAHGCYSADDCLAWLATREAAVVISDVQMPGTTGIELASRLREAYPALRVIILTGASSVDIAIQAIRAGAFDYIAKPVEGDALALAISRALDHVALDKEVKRLRTTVPHTELIIGDCPPIRKLLEMIDRVTERDATVLVVGEPGTGKELVARALHDRLPRLGPFIAVNCAAIPAELLESELFGDVGGCGLFVQAGAGTIFLDEVGELPLDLQSKLLRALQERMVRPAGGDEEVPFQARVVAATRDLDAEIGQRLIDVVAIPVPPLRVRGNDILVLAQHFLHKITARNSKPVAGISAAAARLLRRYDWPGNVRELESCIERAVALCRLDEITVEDLPQKIQTHGNELAVAIGSPHELITLDEMERRYIRHVLELLRGNKTRAARTLGIDRRSLYRRLEALSGARP